MYNPIFAFVVATGISILSGFKVIEFLSWLKFRQTVRDDIPESHQQKQGTPTMGGLLILGGAAVGVGANVAAGAGIVLGQQASSIWGVALMMLAFGLLGFLDDYLIAVRGKNLGLKARHKLLGQFMIAIVFMLWIHNQGRPFETWINVWSGDGINLGRAYYPLMVLFIVGLSNAVNLSDGLDGLAGGLVFMVVASLGIFAASIYSIDRYIGVLTAGVAGACLGFLWYNCNPAKVFMGDTGSLALGAGIAGIAIAIKQETAGLVLCSLFILEALSVTIQVISFKTRKKRIFKMAPIHHHFELSGQPEQAIVTRFWILQALICFAVVAWTLSNG